MAEYKLNIDINTASVAELEQELGRIQEQFKGVKQGEKGFNDLGQAAQKVSARIKNIELQFEALDAEQRGTAIADAFNGVVGAVGAASSAFIAFGADSSAIEDAEKKLLGIIGVVGGLRDASTGLIALNKLTGGSFTALGTQIKTAFKTGEISAISFRTVLQSLGIGVLITGLAYLVTNLDSVASALGLATDNAEDFEKANDDLEKQISDVNTQTEAQVRLLRAQGVEEKTILQFKVRQNVADLEKIRNQKVQLENTIDQKIAEGKTVTEGEKAQLQRLKNLETTTLAAQFEILNAIIKIDKDAEAARQKLLKDQQAAAAKRKADRDKQAKKDKEEADKQAADATQAAIDLENTRADLIADNQEQEFKDSLDRLDNYYTQRETVLKQNLLNGLITQEEFDQQSLDLEIEKNNALLVAYDDYQQDATDILDEQTDLRLKLQKKEAEASKKLTDDQIQDAKDLATAKMLVLDATSQILGSLVGLAGENEKQQKAFGLAQVAVDTAIALSNAQASAFSPADPTNAVTGGLAGIAKYASYAAIILSNAVKAKAIINSGTVSGGTTASGGAALGQTTRPTFQAGSVLPTIQNTAGPGVGGASQTGQVGQDLTGGRVIKTYVLAGDVTSAQQADEKIKQKRKF